MIAEYLDRTRNINVSPESVVVAPPPSPIDVAIGVSKPTIVGTSEAAPGGT